MADGEPASGAKDGSRPAAGGGAIPATATGAGTSPAIKVALAALLVAVVLAGAAAAIPGAHPDAGPWHGYGTPLGAGLEVVLAALLAAAQTQRRRVPSVGQPAAGLRAVLRAVLITGLVAIPALILASALGKLRITHRPKRIPGGARRVHHGPLHPQAHGPGFDLAPLLYAVLAALLLAAIVACVILIRRRSRAAAAVDLGAADDDESQEQLRRAVASGQAALREVDDARLAIIACYVAMELSLAQAGAARGDAETPDELLDRAAAAGLVHGGEAGRLTALFYEARYSTHPLPGDRREEAQRALRVLAAGLSQRAERAPSGGSR